MLNDFTMVKDDYIYFTGDELEMYIPVSYEASKMIEIGTESCNVFGLFNCRVNNGGKKGKIETFNFPSMVEIKAIPEEEVNMEVLDEVEKYFIIRIRKNEPIMRSQFQRNSTNVNLFINMLTGGKLPKTIAYNKILEIWQRNLAMNSVHLNVSSVVLEAIIAEIYRDKKNPQNRFAITIGKTPNGNEYDYATANVRQITSYNSVFSGLTFEDMDQMRIDGINTTNYKRKQTISPIEEIIKM